MTPDEAAELRKPFPPGSVGKLPQPYKKDSPRGNCHECGQYHGLPAMHLDYVGHAVVTGRLLDIDPEWTWEPLALDPLGLPALDREGNLWIRLAVLGVHRLGVGDGPTMKVRIGDALRNAAMRFGVALDLWSKEELEGQEHNVRPEGHQQPTTAAEESQEAAEPVTLGQALAQAREARERRGEARRGPAVRQAQARSWDALVECYPEWEKADRMAETTDELAKVGATPETATELQWQQLAERWEAQADEHIRSRYAEQS